MPKISKVGKFRKTAAATAAALGGGSSSGKKKSSSATPGEVDWVRVPSKKSLQQESALETESSKTDTTATSKKNKKNQKDSSASADVSQQDSALSRGQRKRQAKREQYLKKEKMILSSLKLKKEDEQKKRIDGLDALKAALLETVQEKPGTPNDDNEATVPEKPKPLTSNKAKQKILASELTHMGLVMQHPAFQANPFEAIQEHLRNSLAKQGKQQQAATAVKIKEEQEAAQQRKQEKKERMSVAKKHKKTKRKFKATRSRSKK